MAWRSFLSGDQLNRSHDIEHFEKRLGYHFQTLSHLQEALTHPSRGSATRQDNQRLEFLGDRVLGLVMAQALLERDPTASEGLLAPRYNALVRKEACASVARDIDIGAVLKLGRSEMMSGGRRKDALLADALEAVIAAIYLDGGFPAAQQVILALWGDRVTMVRPTHETLKPHCKNGRKVAVSPHRNTQFYIAQAQIMHPSLQSKSNSMTDKVIVLLQAVSAMQNKQRQKPY